MAGLRDKASRIDFGNLPSAAVSTSVGEVDAVPASRPKTAPGMMMAHAADQRSEILRENDELKVQVTELGNAAGRAAELTEELKAWDGAKATRLIDPTHIKWSAWANRDEANFSGSEFLDLKSEIESAGGNVQPIKVRAIAPENGEPRYEPVFGHRRHRACLELGLPVLAVIDNIGDVDLFVQMDRENRNRKNLSAWEQGKMYQRALDKGLFPSNRQLADKVGVDLAQVGKALSLARLPNEVIDAFASPLELQFRWAKPLADAAESDRRGLVARALKAKLLGSERTAAKVLSVLLSQVEQGGGTVLPQPMMIEREGKTVATVELDSKGRAIVSFAVAVVPASQLNELAKVVENFVAKLPKLKK